MRKKREAPDNPPKELDHPKRHNGRRTTKEQQEAVESVKELVEAVDPGGEALALQDDKDPMFGLTEQQRMIYRMKMRGLAQGQIAKFLNISQPAVSKHLKHIREHMAERGAHINQDVVVGETTSLYEEIEFRAWEAYHSTKETGEQLKALQLVMQAREKNINLLMNLGRIERAASKSTVEVTVSPLVQKWSSGQAQVAVAKIIEAQLSELPQPEPPQLTEGSHEEVLDGEVFDE